MMTFESDVDTGVIELVVDGGVTKTEYDAAVAAMEGLITLRGKIAAIAVIRGFTGMELAAWWKDVTWGVGHMSKVTRSAIVTDSDWIATATKMGAHVVPMEVRVFPLAELEAARAWIRAG